MHVQCDFCTLHSSIIILPGIAIAHAIHSERWHWLRCKQRRSIEMVWVSAEERGWNVLFYNLKNMLNYVLIYLQMACVLCVGIECFIFSLWNYYDIVRDVIKFYYFVCLVNNPAAGQFYKHISFEMCLSFGLLFFTWNRLTLRQSINYSSILWAFFGAAFYVSK